MELNFFTLLFVSFPFIILLSSPHLALSHENAKAPSPSPSKSPASAPKSSSFAPKSSPSIVDNDQPDPTENDPLSTLLGSITLPKLPLTQPRFESLEPSIKKICGVTDDASLCATTILPFLKGDVDPVIALETEITVALEFIIGTHKKFMVMASDKSQPSIASKCLETCTENYDSAIDDLKESLEALTQHDIGALKSRLSAVITHLGTCRDAFKEEGIELPLASELAFKIRMLASNCMAISTLID